MNLFGETGKKNEGRKKFDLKRFFLTEFFTVLLMTAGLLTLHGIPMGKISPGRGDGRERKLI